ncbi:MAG: hypothetical protein IPL42_12515 [Saprospiraceae bacterium]|nr:hypothetical protein [Saprospiraceae bacterium]
MNSWDSIKRFLNQLRKDFKFTDIYSGKTTADKSWFSSAVLMIWKILFAGIGFLYLCLIFV